MNTVKTLIAGIVLAAAPMAMAGQCTDANGKDISNNPAVFQDLISKKTNCWEAAELARACAYGSSLDVRTVSEAYAVCEKVLAQRGPKKEDTALLNAMTDRCQAYHNQNGGTMAISSTAYCHLSAIQFIVNMDPYAENY